MSFLSVYELRLPVTLLTTLHDLVSTPGSFTNYITRSFKEPRLIIVTDPRVDHQAIREAAYVNIP